MNLPVSFGRPYISSGFLHPHVMDWRRITVGIQMEIRKAPGATQLTQPSDIKAVALRNVKMVCRVVLDLTP